MVAPATGLVTCAAIAVRPGAFCAAAGDTASNDAPIIRAAENFIQSTPQVFAGCAWELVGMADISRPSRSEEHTSELQSLMRISYAVFCLKKKKQTKKSTKPI